MYNTVLVPLDGSKRAEAILPHVEALVERCSPAKVILLRVVEPESTFPELNIPYPEAMQDYAAGTAQAEAYLTNIQEKLRGKGIETQVYIAHGSPVEGILNAASHNDVDLIAMASHGRTGLQRVFYGSVAAGVLNRVDHPLLLVRSRRIDNE